MISSEVRVNRGSNGVPPQQIPGLPNGSVFEIFKRLQPAVTVNGQKHFCRDPRINIDDRSFQTYFLKENFQASMQTDHRSFVEAREAFGSIFPPADASPTPPIPEDEMISYALYLFNETQAPADKIYLLHKVLRAPNSTDGIAKKFYEALPKHMQADFKVHIFWTNRNPKAASLINQQYHISFSEYMVGGELRSKLVQQAAVNYYNSLR